MYARWREASNRFWKSEKPYRVLRLMAAEAAVSVQPPIDCSGARATTGSATPRARQPAFFYVCHVMVLHPSIAPAPSLWLGVWPHANTRW